MLVVMERDASADDIRRCEQVIAELGYTPQTIPGSERTAIGVVGNDGRVDATRLGALPGVREIVHITKPYRQVSREWQADDTLVTVGEDVTIGGTGIPIIAGPCAVESQQQIIDIARAVRDAGACLLRGGAFKPRTSPYAFQGIGTDGLVMLASAREETGLPVVTEALDPESVDVVEEYCDVIQIGSRNMQNFSLLKRVARSRRPVMLKRGAAATIVEWLLSAEYILDGGNPRVILCERGIRGFDPTTRNVLDLASIPATQALTHLPVIADPSHGTGRRDLVIPMARAAVACGADAVMVEVHTQPDRARSDGRQSLYPEQFAELVASLREVAKALDRTVLDLTSPARA